MGSQIIAQFAKLSFALVLFAKAETLKKKV